MIEEAPFTSDIAEAMRRVPRADVQTCLIASWPRQRFISAFQSSAATGESAPPMCRPFGNVWFFSCEGPVQAEGNWGILSAEPFRPVGQWNANIQFALREEKNGD